MNGLEMTIVLQRDVVARRFFQNVFTSDLLPKKFEAGIYVVNTHPITKPGEHWVIYYKSKEHLEFFDSLGHQPSYYHSHWPHAAVYNHQEIQGNSPTCGLYCLYFAIKRCRGKCMSEIVSVFNKDKQHNDEFIKEYMRRYFRQ